MINETSKGNHAQEYRKAHELFLKKWAEGLEPLEIGLLLKLSRAQLAKHSLEAYQAQAERLIPPYGCILWQDLPQSVRRLLPGEKNDVFRVEGDATGVTISKSPITGPENL